MRSTVARKYWHSLEIQHLSTSPLSLLFVHLSLSFSLHLTIPLFLLTYVMQNLCTPSFQVSSSPLSFSSSSFAPSCISLFCRCRGSWVVPSCLVSLWQQALILVAVAVSNIGGSGGDDITQVR